MRGEAKEDPLDSPDKIRGGAKMLSSEDLQLYTDTGKKERVSFVFKELIAIVASAYSALEAYCD